MVTQSDGSGGSREPLSKPGDGGNSSGTPGSKASVQDPLAPKPKSAPERDSGPEQAGGRDQPSVLAADPSGTTPSTFQEDAGPGSVRRVTTPEERRWAFLLLFLSLTCLGMGQTVIFAILPPVSRELGMMDFQVGAIFMVSAAFWLVMSPFWGRLSDTWARKPVILIGLSGFVASTVAFASLLYMGLAGLAPLAFVYPMMILSRTIYGTLGPGAMGAAQAYVADRTSIETRTRSLAGMGAAFGLGTTMGPGMVAVLSPFGILAPLFGVAILGIVSIFAIAFFLPERTGPRERKAPPMLRPWDVRIRDALCVAVLFSTAHAIAVQTATFFIIDRFSVGPEKAAQTAGFALLGMSLAALVTQLIILPRLRWTVRQLMIRGGAIVCAGFVVMITAGEIIQVVAAMTMLGSGGALARSGSMGAASLSVSPDEQGAVAGLVSSTGGAGFVVAPLLAFPLYSVMPNAPYLASMSLAGIAVLLLIFKRSIALDAVR